MTADLLDPETAFAEALARRAAEADAALDALLAAPERPVGDGERRVVDAMRYAALGGGKRLRAFLTLETAALFAVRGPGPVRAAAAVECLHAYSLAHDDLPCMDDDDLRRGKPTAHIAFDEATAVLAGDALQSRAFEILADPATDPEAAVRAELVLVLAKAAGAAGMVGGQMLDIAAENAAEAGGPPLDLAAIERLQALKTGALIRAAAAMGAALGRAAPAARAAIDRFAHALGRAFQIADDLIDVAGDEAAAGKRLRKDEAAGKATFVDLLGVEGARARAAELVDEAEAALAPFGPAATLLRQAARFSARRSR